MEKEIDKIKKAYTKGVERATRKRDRQDVIRFFRNEYQIFSLQIKLFYRDAGMLRASALAYSSLLALIPLLAVFFMIFKLFGGKEIVNRQVKPFVYSFLTPVSEKQFSVYIDTFLDSATVDTLGSLGVIFLVFGVFSILSQIEDNFNFIWHVKRSRDMIDKLKVYWLIITLLPLLMALSIALSSYVEFVILLGETFLKGFSNFMLFNFLPFLLVVCFFTMAIKIIPNCEVYVKDAFIGGLFGTIFYYISKNLFVEYSKMAVSYNIIYGSLSILPIFMIWIYFFWIIVLLSVELSFVRQNIHSLTSLENNMEINHCDEYKVAILVCIKMVRDYINSKQLDPVSEYAGELNIPLHHVRNTFTDLEKSNMVKQIGHEQDIYLPNIPIKDFSVNKIVNSIDKRYISDIKIDNEMYNSMLKTIMDEVDICKENESNICIEQFITSKL